MMYRWFSIKESEYENISYNNLLNRLRINSKWKVLCEIGRGI